MNRNLKATDVTGVSFAIPFGFSLAVEKTSLMINGEIGISVREAAPEQLEKPDEIRSDRVCRKAQKQGIQAVDLDGPGMNLADADYDVGNTILGENCESRAPYHGSPEEMVIVSPVYPKWNEETGEVRTMSVRIRSCLTDKMGALSRCRGRTRDTRAETYTVGSPESVALELNVMSRGNGLDIEGPSVPI